MAAKRLDKKSKAKAGQSNYENYVSAVAYYKITYTQDLLKGTVLRTLG